MRASFSIVAIFASLAVAIPFSGPEPTAAPDAAAIAAAQAATPTGFCATKTMTVLPRCAAPTGCPPFNIQCITTTTSTSDCPPLPTPCDPSKGTTTVHTTLPCPTCQTGCKTETAWVKPEICTV